MLLITPRIVRNIERPELADSEFFGGTESAASDQSLQLRPAPGIATVLPQGQPVAPVEERAAVEGVSVDVPALPPMQPPVEPAQ